MSDQYLAGNFPSTGQPEHITICIPTKGRGASIAGTITSLQAMSYESFDVVIVDQSADDATARAVEALIGNDARFKYIHSATAGSSVARNLAVARATGPLIAFTDDDCDVPPDWLARIAAHFAADPALGQICGEVLPAHDDLTLGFIPTYYVPIQRRIASPWLKWREGGIGANMAFRLDVLRAVGPFDEVLGAGGPLYACLDGDMTYRVLAAGYAVLNVSDVYVVHRGFRTWQEGRRMIRRTAIGVAAAYVKPLRMGDLAVLPTLLLEWLRTISWKRLLLLRRYSGIARFVYFGYGILLSFRYRIDRHRRVYTTAR
jgi:glycosyltransferase involved in cell wall biosynthesis